VATDLGFVVVEEATATLVSISQQLWKPVTAHLGLGVVDNRSTALHVGQSWEWDSAAADLILAVVGEVSAAFIAIDGAYRKGGDEFVAAHEELRVEGEFSAAVDLEI